MGKYATLGNESLHSVVSRRPLWKSKVVCLYLTLEFRENKHKCSYIIEGKLSLRLRGILSLKKQREATISVFLPPCTWLKWHSWSALDDSDSQGYGPAPHAGCESMVCTLLNCALGNLLISLYLVFLSVKWVMIMAHYYRVMMTNKSIKHLKQCLANKKSFDKY